MPSARDPREIITPAAFRVAPDLLGVPLARPWRRGMAMLIDLAFCGMLVGLVKIPSVLLSAAVAVLLFRLTRDRKGPAPLWRRAFRFTGRATLAIVLFGMSIAILSELGDRFGGDNDEAPHIEVAGVPLRGGLVDAGFTLADIAALTRASSDSEATAVANRIHARLMEEDLNPDEIRALNEAIEELEAEFGDEIGRNAFAALRGDSASTGTAAESPTDSTATSGADTPLKASAAGTIPDSLALAYAAALRAGDTIAAAAIRPTLGAVLAADRIAELDSANARLTRRVDRLGNSNERLEEALEEAEESKGFLSLLRGLADDLGLGFGWFMLYFTAFTALWQGHTPGKRFLGIRVIRLDGQPLGWWLAFERAGGYSASFATGLLGFLQIFWDRNRQGIHDKVASTVVIQERNAPPRSPLEQATGSA